MRHAFKHFVPAMTNTVAELYYKYAYCCPMAWFAYSIWGYDGFRDITAECDKPNQLCDKCALFGYYEKNKETRVCDPWFT
jgi:hypothetical protein